MRRPTDPHPIPRAVLATLLLLAASGCRTGGPAYEGEDPYRNAVREGRLQDAKALAEERLAANPDDELARKRSRDIEVMIAIDRARELTFEDRPQAALDVLLAVQDVDPGNQQLGIWIAKTRRQLAGEWHDIANDYSGDANLVQAEAALRRALLYDPDNVEAKRDLERLTIRAAYREDMSREYFYTGLRKLREARLESADRDLGIATLYDEANDAAARRRRDVRQRLARETLANALGYEEQGLNFAAFNEFRAVLFHDPDNAEALAGAQRLAREVQAEQHLAKAEMMVRRQEFELARLELEQARTLTQTMHPRIDRLEGEIEEARWEALYDKGLALYEDRRYEAAVATLDELLAQAEDYRDASDQREALLESISAAQKLYERALATEDLEQRLGLLRQIHEVHYPEFRDVRERIERLRAQLSADGS